MRNKIVRGVLIVLGLLVVALGVAVFVFLRPFPAGALALVALQNNNNLTITNTSDQIVFMPSDTPKAGLIFYPGARVDAAAYSPALKAIAEAGYAVFVVKFPLNFAILGVNRADNVMQSNPRITRWAIAGHSLGGAMACNYTNSSSRVQVLVFWAAYCDRSFDLSGRSDVQVTSISASLDGLATPEKIASTRAFAPASARYVVIEGGNHAQFGDYGPQAGDQPATIPPDEQTRQIVAAMLKALELLK
jgi:pimeloyl-ACP methyl ester carboxylesterase